MLQGTIDEFPLMDVLGILQARNKTGRLEIERQAGRGLIYVRLGEPYYAESSLTRSLIGQKLVDIGAITDMQLRKALDHQADSGERLGQILLTHGVISAADVAQAVISQIKDALADLLAWEAGEFRWETGAEVEVEVPLFGGGNGSVGVGSNPLAPHVIPINAQEPDAGTDTPQAESVVAEMDFPQGGTTMTGNEVSAKSIDSVPEVGQDPSLDVVGSSDEEAEDVAEEPEEVTAPVDGLDSETEFEATEVQETDPETEVEETQPQSEPVDESDALTDPVSEAEEGEDEIEESTPVHELDEPNDENESEPDADPVFDRNEDVVAYDEDVPVSEPDPETEPVHELDENETETEPEPVASHQDEVEDTEPEETEPEETGAAHELDAVAETDLSPLTPVPEQFHVPRIIRSQPAPELDEEFEAVFEATARASFEDEPLMEDVAEPSTEPEAESPYLDTQPIVDPVFGSDAFTPIAPVTGFDHPTFVPDNGSAVFDHGSFEPLPENPEPPSESIAETSDEPVDETVDGALESPFEPIAETYDEPVGEHVDEALESPFEPIAETYDEPVGEHVDEALESSFEPIAETTYEPVDERVDEALESPFWPLAATIDEQDEPVDESLDSAFAAVVETLHSGAPEPEIEAPEPAFEKPFDPAIGAFAPDPPELAEPEATEMPDADLMPVASPPPPPPEVEEPKAVNEVAAEKALAAPADPSTPESLKDIKLDRASLVRELSDLLR